MLTGVANTLLRNPEDVKMSNSGLGSDADHDEASLVRLIFYAGLMALPVLTLFVHLLLIYRN